MSRLFNIFGQPIVLLTRRDEDETYNFMYRLADNAEYWHNHKNAEMEKQSLQMMINFCNSRISDLDGR